MSNGFIVKNVGTIRAIADIIFKILKNLVEIQGNTIFIDFQERFLQVNWVADVNVGYSNTQNAVYYVEDSFLQIPVFIVKSTEDLIITIGNFKVEKNMMTNADFLNIVVVVQKIVVKVFFKIKINSKVFFANSVKTVRFVVKKSIVITNLET